jgi:hypothetical protein
LQKTHLTPIQQNSLDFAKNIIDGKVNIAVLELDLTIAKTFNKPLMRSIFKGETSQIGYSIVNVLVTRFIHSFGFSNKMDSMQIETLTVDTLDKFSYETLEDIVLFFKMARSGSFGATNRGVDSNLIYGEWFPKYLEKKSEIREQNYSKSKGVNSRVQATDDDVRITYEKLAKKNKIIQVEKYVDEITKNMDRQLLEDTILDWGKDPIKKPYLDILKRKRKELKR